MFKNLIPWQKKEENPLLSFRRNMDKLFEDFVDDFGGMKLASWPFGKDSFLPSVDVSEDAKSIQVSAELPGMTEKDVEVCLHNNVLTVKGEKKHEEEKKEQNYHCIERRYGSFHRSIPLPEEVETEKIEASFKNGILSIVIPKKETAQEKGKKIEIKTS
ncbi:MAG: Hsp20/alpha crystallin family protein [Candidatus Brocadiae bacterium]|nr:Hsp20/alpha crystallin family protein [Candidatus Brocadiia bacterium]